MSRGSETTNGRCVQCGHSRERHCVSGRLCWFRMPKGLGNHRCNCSGFRAFAPPKPNSCINCGDDETLHYISNKGNGCAGYENRKYCGCPGFRRALDPLPHGLSSLVSMPDFSKMTILEAETWFQRLAAGGTPGADLMARWLRRLYRLETTWHQVEVLHGDIRRAMDNEAPVGWTEGK